MNTLFHRKALIITLALLSLGAFALTANASHSWGGYHWARTANPFTIKLGDNVSTTWDSYLATTSVDWSVSSVLNTAITTGANLRNCSPVAGRVEVCNKKYGSNGWLGIASIWISGGHITQGTVKVNDTYFNTATYNTPAWKNLVMCQEVGHTLGLNHQDEISSNTNLGTCMDYTNDSSTNQHPNQHDYEQLVAIYSHLDSTTTIGATTISKGNFADVNMDNLSAWGKQIRKDSRSHGSLYERDLGGGNKVFTFVTWVE